MSGYTYTKDYPDNITTGTNISVLWGRNEERTPARFQLSAYKNAIRVKVNTGLQQDKEKDNKSISFAIKDADINSFVGVLTAFRNTLIRDIDDHTPFTYPVHLNAKKKGGETIEIGKFILGRNDEGRCYVLATKSGYGKVPFFLEDSRNFVKFDPRTREPMDPKTSSTIFAIGWVETISSLLLQTLANEYTDPPSDKGDKGGYKKGGNSYNKGSGQSSSSDDYDEYY